MFGGKDRSQPNRDIRTRCGEYSTAGAKSFPLADLQDCSAGAADAALCFKVSEAQEAEYAVSCKAHLVVAISVFERLGAASTLQPFVDRAAFLGGFKFELFFSCHWGLLCYQRRPLVSYHAQRTSASFLRSNRVRAPQTIGRAWVEHMECALSAD